MNGKLGSGKRFAKLEHSLAHRPGIRDAKAVAASIGRKKFGNKGMENLAEKGHLAMGGMSSNEKLHPRSEPSMNVGSMVTAILRRRTGSQAPQLMAEGGAVDPREAQRQRERQQANQEFVNEHAAGGPPTGASGSMNERLRQRETERNQEDEATGQRLAFGGDPRTGPVDNRASGRRADSGGLDDERFQDLDSLSAGIRHKLNPDRSVYISEPHYDPEYDLGEGPRTMNTLYAYGGQVDGDDEAAVRQSDFLALEGTDGMGRFDHDPLDPEAGKLRRKRILGEIMDDLAAEHYGRT